MRMTRNFRICIPTTALNSNSARIRSRIIDVLHSQGTFCTAKALGACDHSLFLQKILCSCTLLCQECLKVVVVDWRNGIVRGIENKNKRLLFCIPFFPSSKTKGKSWQLHQVAHIASCSV